MTLNQLTHKFRDLVIGVDTLVPIANGTYITAVNFDNAASTPPFHSVLDEIINFAPWYSSVHRGTGYKSIVSTNVYETGRKIVKDFVGANPKTDLVIYTKNTTESINLLSYLLYKKDKNQVVISTSMEHLANDLPWRDKFFIDYLETNEQGRLELEQLEAKLIKYRGRVKLVTVTGASNVTGYVNPVHEMAGIAHKYGAEILVDGAQSVPHLPVDMKSNNSAKHLDYLVFSAHKMYAPFGIGVLIGPQKTFEKISPVYQGGGNASLVTRDFVQWTESPAKDEAGSPNIMGVVALISAIKTLQTTGMNLVHQYETALTDYALKLLQKIPDLELYTKSSKGETKVSIIPFNIKGIPFSTVTQILSLEDGITVRGGLFCAHPYVQNLLNLTPKQLKHYLSNPESPLPGMLRISFGLYNTFSEIDRLIKALNRIVNNKHYYLSKYYCNKINVNKYSPLSLKNLRERACLSCLK